MTAIVFPPTQSDINAAIPAFFASDPGVPAAPPSRASCSPLPKASFAGFLQRLSIGS